MVCKTQQLGMVALGFTWVLLGKGETSLCSVLSAHGPKACSN